MTHVLFGSLLLSAAHAFIPSHWIPFVAIGRAEGWSRSETLAITGISGLAHAAGTILIGILVGLLGLGLTTRHASLASIAAPSVLIGLGVLYLALELAARRHHRHPLPTRPRPKRASRLPIVASLCLAMFFSPCIEIEAYYFTAGILGWRGIAVVSLVYLAVTVMGMLVLVDLALKGTARMRSRFLEHHEKGVTGLLLVALGASACFIAL